MPYQAMQSEDRAPSAGLELRQQAVQLLHGTEQSRSLLWGAFLEPPIARSQDPVSLQVEVCHGNRLEARPGISELIDHRVPHRIDRDVHIVSSIRLPAMLRTTHDLGILQDNWHLISLEGKRGPLHCLEGTSG